MCNTKQLETKQVLDWRQSTRRKIEQGCPSGMTGDPSNNVWQNSSGAT